MSDIKKDNFFQKDNLVSTLEYQPQLFHNDQNIYLLYKKIENISSAVFLVTQAILEENVLKNALRQKILDTLTSVVSALGNNELRPELFDTISILLIHTHSLVENLYWSGAISYMNATLLQSEIDRGQNLSFLISSTHKTKFTLDPLFFERNQDFQAVQDRGPLESSKRHKGQVLLKDIYLSDKKTERRDTILKLLKEKSHLTIKDFSEVIKNYSEKTIQRELLALVQEGLVVRKGERRWSVYSLAH